MPLPRNVDDGESDATNGRTNKRKKKLPQNWCERNGNEHTEKDNTHQVVWVDCCYFFFDGQDTIIE